MPEYFCHRRALRVRLACNCYGVSDAPSFKNWANNISCCGSAFSLWRLRTPVKWDDCVREDISPAIHIRLLCLTCASIVTDSSTLFHMATCVVPRCLRVDLTVRDVLSRAELYLTIIMPATFPKPQARPGPPLGVGDRCCARIRWKK